MKPFKGGQRMPNTKSRKLFDRISPVYGRLYERQHKNYTRIFKEMDQCNLSHFSTILDVGCGSGAMACVFTEMGLTTFAMDQSWGMLRVAKSRHENENVRFCRGSIESGLPFPENSFDIVIASFVAHGIDAKQRLELYEEMRRVGKHLAILHDYNGVRSLSTSIAEIAEGGDYFNFIRNVKGELKNYFGNLEIIETEKRSCCYVCNVG
jgi:ubiquinone/menaquinone biosynthesis C-methylase UbiE